jgi:transposase
MAGKRRTYTPEYKLAAVKMITDQKLSVAEAARRLGISENRLHEWKTAHAAKGADAFPGSGHLTPLEEENRKLRAEVKRLEMERDILKKLRRSSPLTRADLRLDRGTQRPVADHRPLSRAGRVARRVLRVAVS